MLVVKNLAKKYPKFCLNISDFSISTDLICGLVGNNGAGKTTFLKLIFDLLESDSGRVLIDGVEIKENPLWKKSVGVFLDESFLIDYLTVDEYLYFIGHIYQLSDREIEERIREFSNFFRAENPTKLIKDYSLGNRYKIGIVKALFCRPKFVVLDEPFAHLDPNSRLLLEKIIINYQGIYKTTFLISSHDLSSVETICDQIVLMEDGKIYKNLFKDQDDLSAIKQYFTEHNPNILSVC